MTISGFVNNGIAFPCGGNHSDLRQRRRGRFSRERSERFCWMDFEASVWGKIQTNFNEWPANKSGDSVN